MAYISHSPTPNFEARMKEILESELLRACRTGDKDCMYIYIIIPDNLNNIFILFRAQLVDDKNVALDCIDISNGLQPLIIASKYGHFEIVTPRAYLLKHSISQLTEEHTTGCYAGTQG